MSNEQSAAKPPNGRKHWSAAQIFGIISTTAAITLGGITIWQTSSIRHMEDQAKSVEKLGTKIDAVKDLVTALDKSVTAALSSNDEKLKALKERFDLHESRESKR